MRPTIILLIILSACSGTTTHHPDATQLTTPTPDSDTTELKDSVQTLSNHTRIESADTLLLEAYSNNLADLLTTRRAIAPIYNASDSTTYPVLAQARNVLFKVLLNQVFPAWYGTTWDYNGYTNTPNNGLIACGYFVSTTLKHAGFNMNRYDVAKSYSRKIVSILCDSSTLATYTDINDLMSHIDQRTDDIYVIGLSNHVGFIVKDDTIVDFIHSNYGYPMCVIRETAITSEALNWSNEYWVGSLLNSESTIKKWLHNDIFD